MRFMRRQHETLTPYVSNLKPLAKHGLNENEDAGSSCKKW
jgi:hypothetical protein